MPQQQTQRDHGAAFPRSFRRSYLEAVRGGGVYLIDAPGKRYIDFSGSAAVNFIGHGDQEVIEAIAQQGKSLEFAHTSQFTTPVAETFAREVLEFAGPAFAGGAVYFTSGGSEAVETALKLARQYQVDNDQPRRFRVLSRRQSYHGATLGAMQVSGNVRRRDIYKPMFRDPSDRDQVSAPYCYRCPFNCMDCTRQFLEEFSDTLERVRGEVAAFIMEPISGATLGASVPQGGYVEGIAELCRRHDVLLIADEVMTGFGRTGKNFAMQHWNTAADIIVCGKGIASGYAPLGAVIASARVVDTIARGTGSFIHGFTYNGHPLSVAAGRVVLRKIRQQQLVRAADDSSGAVGQALMANLTSLYRCESVGNVRGKGLLWGIEFIEARDSKKSFAPDLGFADLVASEAMQRGVLVYPGQGCVDGTSGDLVLIAPPATITPAQIEEAANALGEAIAAAERAAHSE
jgi:adenosylmethionine-8-amino-7-oxononanoate aminotransferase